MPIPPELYLGVAVLAILIVLLFAVFGRKTTRRDGLRPHSDTEQLLGQLTRIADALEKLVVHFGALSPRVEQPLVPQQKTNEKTPQAENKDQEVNPSKPGASHVSLSMFGR